MPPLAWTPTLRDRNNARVILGPARAMLSADQLAHVGGCAGGFCDSRAKRIVVDSGAPANGRVRTLVLEIVHTSGLGVCGRFCFGQ